MKRSLCLALLSLLLLAPVAGAAPGPPRPPFRVSVLPAAPTGGEAVMLRVAGRPGAAYRVLAAGRELALYRRPCGGHEILLPLEIEASGPLSLPIVEIAPDGRETTGTLFMNVAAREIRVVRLGPAAQRMRREQPSIREQQEKVLAALNHRSETRYWRAPFVMPLQARISSGFAVKRVRDDSASFHRGVDFAAPLGTPVGSVADGRVLLAGRDFNIYGNLLIIDHGQGVVSCYFHLDRLFKECGDAVSSGEVIAEVGSTGWSSGPHLHLGIYLQGRAVDPLWFIVFTDRILRDDDDRVP